MTDRIVPDIWPFYVWYPVSFTGYSEQMRKEEKEQNRIVNDDRVIPDNRYPAGYPVSFAGYPAGAFPLHRSDAEEEAGAEQVSQ